MKLSENRRPTAIPMDPNPWTAAPEAESSGALRNPIRWSEKVDQGTKSLVFRRRTGIRYRITNPRHFAKMVPSGFFWQSCSSVEKSVRRKFDFLAYMYFVFRDLCLTLYLTSALPYGKVACLHHTLASPVTTPDYCQPRIGAVAFQLVCGVGGVICGWIVLFSRLHSPLSTDFWVSKP